MFVKIRWNNYLVALAVLLNLADAASQVVPGYRGKKCSVSYKAQFSPALSRPNYFNRVSSRVSGQYAGSKESAFIPFNISHGAAIERVVGRKVSIGFNYVFAASKDYISFTENRTDKLSGREEEIAFNNCLMNFYAHHLTGSLTLFGKKALAPFGEYVKLDLGYVSMYGAFAEPPVGEPVREPSRPYTTYTLDTKGIYYGTPGVSFGYAAGVNRIYYDKLIVNRGIAFYYFVRTDSNDAKNILKTMYKRMVMHDVLNFYLSVGYLF